MLHSTFSCKQAGLKASITFYTSKICYLLSAYAYMVKMSLPDMMGCFILKLLKNLSTYMNAQ